MKMRNLLTATAAWAAVLTPTIGTAQDDGGFMLDEAPAEEAEPLFANELELGIGYNSEDSFKFGEYTGLAESELFPIVNFDLLSRPAWDSEETRYYRIRGERLGLDSRFIEGEYGDQGSYSVGLRYREIPHYLIDDARVPYRGTGGTELSLPPGWTPATSNQAFPDLGTSLRSVDIKNERQQLTGLLSLLPGDGWTLDVELGHENRDGTKPTYAAFGTNGGNPSIVAFPRPVEWKTNDIKTTLGYAEKKYQFELEYHGSFFNNDNEVVRFQNPYSGTFSGSPWAAAAAYPAAGGMGLPPDNQSHQFLFSGGYTLGAASRLSGQLSYAMLEQDEQFLPYSSNPALLVTRGLPRQSLDGDLAILTADLAYSTRLQPRTHLRARVRYEDQDNSTPRDVYVRIAGDAQNQPAGLANGNARLNLPYSFDKFRFNTELSHRLASGTGLGLEYEFENHSRTFAEVEETDEHTVTGKLRHRFSNTINSRFSYTHAERDGNDPYRDNTPFLAGHTTELLATLAPDDRFENHPAVRKYNIADRSLNEVKGSVHISASEATSWSLNGSWRLEDFDDTSLGLTERQLLRAAVDLNHELNDNVMLRGYYSFEQF
ncbi:MAG TPA: MtrB/PioB family decaheme-associated outer membrane protein, partial [Arenicellales bacterium]|nr:MtrB/PioB family decaheme-associated outer membrane protein [Arenicellales bacterium]